MASTGSRWRRQPSAARGAARGTRFGADGARPVGRSGPSFAPRPPPRTGPAASLAMASAGRRGLLLPSLRPRAEDVLSSRKGRADRPHRHPFLIPCLQSRASTRRFPPGAGAGTRRGGDPRRWPRQCVQRPHPGLDAPAAGPAAVPGHLRQAAPLRQTGARSRQAGKAGRGRGGFSKGN